jgi:hypothetical protein
MPKGRVASFAVRVTALRGRSVTCAIVPCPTDARTADNLSR